MSIKIIDIHPDFLIGEHYNDDVCIRNKIDEYQELKKEGKLVDGEKFLRNIFLNIADWLEGDERDFYLRNGVNSENYYCFEQFEYNFDGYLDPEMEEALGSFFVEYDKAVKEIAKNDVVELQKSEFLSDKRDKSIKSFFVGAINCKSFSDFRAFIDLKFDNWDCLNIWELVKFVSGIVELSVDYEDDHMSLGGSILDFVRTFNVERFTENYNKNDKLFN